MARYLIHACLDREWYVNEFLIPSMIRQGIKDEDIEVYLDKNREGNLMSCMKAFESVPDDDGGTWHLQDDILLARSFKEVTEEKNKGIVCGHCYSKHEDRRDYVGEVTVNEMWYSFPCIRIPNKIARGCAEYFRNDILPNRTYIPWITAKKYDDTIFMLYLTKKHPNVEVLNLVPTIVAHIDYLIGGTQAGKSRGELEPMSMYFEEPELIDILRKELKNHEGDYLQKP